MARLIWTEPALADLEAITEYIALDKPEAARALVRKVFRAVDKLVLFPKSGRIPPEIPHLPYREVVVPPCRVFYRFDRRTVVIIHVTRGERQVREGMLEGR
ncbi:MAG TPA: type II toxin-antitoxin system RelE/ParE family toxin [Planctomycetota bacterium]|nr:type II toxin-antitoxin system RelE/ParE family toxin [Planctomycetota bacterium]